ncbi:hypothetical protein FQR65_LT20247 [Abscondita terminalis]|nr:hypothetical protein FQR65_LT20247 [Abscondita terminalis]
MSAHSTLTGVKWPDPIWYESARCAQHAVGGVSGCRRHVAESRAEEQGCRPSACSKRPSTVGGPGEGALFMPNSSDSIPSPWDGRHVRAMNDAAPRAYAVQGVRPVPCRPGIRRDQHGDMELVRRPMARNTSCMAGASTDDFRAAKKRESRPGAAGAALQRLSLAASLARPFSAVGSCTSGITKFASAGCLRQLTLNKPSFNRPSGMGLFVQLRQQ